MSQYSTSVKVISLGLALVYALSLFIYLGHFSDPGGPDASTIVFVALFIVLLVAAISAAAFKEIGRKVLVIGNMVMFLYLFGMYVFKADTNTAGYMLMSLIGMLFYTQTKAKLLYLEEAGGIRKSILVVDDDVALLKSVKPILLNSGYSVLTATSGEKGIQIARRQKPDLILLDVILPGIKGRQVCIKLKEDDATQRIPVIFLTAKDSPDDVKAELAAGAIAHITKPFNTGKLLEEIKKALPS